MISNKLGRLLQNSARAKKMQAFNLVKVPSRNFAFSFAGPRKLDEIIKRDLIEEKTKAEVSDIWMTYHENKERVHGCIASGKEGKLILDRAQKM